MNAFIRMLIMVIVLSVVIKTLFNTDTKKAIVTSIYTEFILVISETFFALVLILAYNMNSNQIVETQFASFISNVLISLISL